PRAPSMFSITPHEQGAFPTCMCAHVIGFSFYSRLQLLSLVEYLATRVSRRVIVAEIGMIFADSSYDITFHDLHVVDIVFSESIYLPLRALASACGARLI